MKSWEFVRRAERFARLIVITSLLSSFSRKDQIIYATVRGSFWQISEVFRFFQGVPLWNHENKGCLNHIKFYEVSGNPKKKQILKVTYMEPWNLPRSPYLVPRRSGPFNCCPFLSRKLLFSGHSISFENKLTSPWWILLVFSSEK